LQVAGTDLLQGDFDVAAPNRPEVARLSLTSSSILLLRSSHLQCFRTTTQYSFSDAGGNFLEVVFSAIT
jgi:hypothetical protein